MRSTLADIDTRINITTQTDGLRSGMAAAADAVETAAPSMTARFADLGKAAQQAQTQVGAAAAQIGVRISALQADAAGLAGANGGAGRVANAFTPGATARGISVTEQAGPAASADGASRLQAWREDLQQQLAAEQSFYGQSKAQELAFWQDKLALTGSGSRERFAVENSIFELEKQLAVQKQRDALSSLDAEQKIADSSYERQRAAIGNEATLGKISASEKIAQLHDALDQQWALDQDYYAKKWAAAAEDSQTQQKLTEEQALAYEKYLTERDRLDTEAVETSQKQWQGLLQPIQRALDTSITGIITGTSTVQRALANLAQSIVAEFVNSAVGGVFGGLGKLLGGSLTGVGSGDQDFSGGAAGISGDLLGGGISEGLFGSGGIFGALGLSDLFSGGGIIGGLFKGIGTLFGFEHGGIVPSAQGGWMVPSTALAMLHTNEMVLPADISQGLQNMIAGGGNSPANVTFAVSAMDAQSVATFFKNNGASLVSAINQAMRNGSMLRSS